VLQYDFENSVGYWLTLANQALQRTLNEELAPTGITYRQSQVIGWLALEDELTLSELAARMLIEPPTLVGIIDRMERAGWIVRTGCDEDRRRKLLRLTPAAEPVWEQMVDCCLRVRRRATAGLSDDQVEQLRELLRHVHENLAPAAVVRA
jgi:MarR family transcriptional regulator, transcriptional regulator for hemolysin